MSDLPAIPPGIVLCTRCGARLAAIEEIWQGAAPLCPDCAEEQADTRKLQAVSSPEWVSICEDAAPEPRRPHRWVGISAAAAVLLLIVAVVAQRPRRVPPVVAGEPPRSQAPLPAAPTAEAPEPSGKVPETPKKEPEPPKLVLPDPLYGELAALDRETAPFEAAEEFKRVFDLLENAKRHRDAEVWVQGIELRMASLRRKVEAHFAAVLQFIEDAKDAAEKEKLRERVGRWGLADLSAALEKALAEVVPPPPPPRSKEAQAYLEEWERVMACAGSRAYDRALPDLRKAAKVAEEEAVRREATADLDDLTRVVMVYEEIQKLLAKWPRGAAIALETLSTRVSGAFVAGDGDRVEIRTGVSRETAFVEISDATAGSLAALARGKADARALGILCLIEGQAAAAMAIFDRRDEVPAKYWAWAGVARSRIPRPDEEMLRVERSAREIYYAAEREYRRPATRGSAVERYRTLMKGYLETTLVRRTAKRIAQRTEGCSEYYLATDDLTAGGTFRKSSRPPFWVSAAESDFAHGHENFVEIEFAAATEEKYRCWIQVGGCCAETLAAFYQTTGLVVPHPVKTGQTARAEPGSLFAVAIMPPAVALKATHALHGGPKEPSIWGWIEVPLPKFPQPGVKRVRLCTVVQGFGVARAVVSSTRTAAPKDEEVKELEAAREPDLPPPISDSKR